MTDDLIARLRALYDKTSTHEWYLDLLEKAHARIAVLEVENAKFRALYDEQLLIAVKVSASLGEKE